METWDLLSKLYKLYKKNYNTFSIRNQFTFSFFRKLDSIWDYLTKKLFKQHLFFAEPVKMSYFIVGINASIDETVEDQLH